MENNNPNVNINPNKVYGSSVLEQIPTPVEDEAFNDQETTKFTEEEIAEMRQELKAGDEGVVKEKITTDALSGVTASSKVSEEYAELDKIDASVEAHNIRGKTLPEHTIERIKTMVGVDITTDDSRRIAQYFESFGVNADGEPALVDVTFQNCNSEDIREALGTSIMDVITKLADNDDEADRIAKRLMEQIYASYHAAVEYNDDMRELSMITRRVKEMADKGIDPNVRSIDNVSDEAVENQLKDLNQTQKWIERYLEIRSKLDSRNKKLKQDYTIDDIDTKTIEEVKVALDDALEMKTLLEGCLSPKFVADFKNHKECDRIIKNWITDIKNDPDTLYTFPTNDYYTIEKTKTDVLDYLYGALLAQQYIDHPIPEDAMADDPGQYYIKSGVATKKDILVIKEKAYLILFTIAKTFKYKKLRLNIYMRRVLSYTLDMMSKMNNPVYRVKFFDLANTLYSRYIK